MSEKQENFTLLDGRIIMAPSLYNPTSDAVWLAAIAPTYAKTVLDVGVGSGGVALCLLQHNPDAKVTGIDISEDMIDACRKNFELNQKEINLINADILHWSTPETFDLVVTNPPYFCGTPAKHGAHHNVDISQWMKRCVARAKPNGHFCTIIDTPLLGITLSILNDKHLGDIKIFPLFGSKDTAERVLISARKSVRTGSTLYKGSSMNNESILRSGMTINELLDAIEEQ